MTQCLCFLVVQDVYTTGAMKQNPVPKALGCVPCRCWPCVVRRRDAALSRSHPLASRSNTTTPAGNQPILQPGQNSIHAFRLVWTCFALLMGDCGGGGRSLTNRSSEMLKTTESGWKRLVRRDAFVPLERHASYAYDLITACCRPSVRPQGAAEGETENGNAKPQTAYAQQISSS